jgi:hypothetical protein
MKRAENLTLNDLSLGKGYVATMLNSYLAPIPEEVQRNQLAMKSIIFLAQNLSALTATMNLLFDRSDTQEFIKSCELLSRELGCKTKIVEPSDRLHKYMALIDTQKHKNRKRRDERMPVIDAATVPERVGVIVAAICPSAIKSREATAEEVILLTNAAVVTLAMNLVFDGRDRQRFDSICQQICKIVMEDAEQKMGGLN